jgi:hypothetical protein
MGKMSEDERRCPDCGHIIKGEELKKRRYYGYFNQQDDDYMRCTKCQRAHDEERARAVEHMPEPSPEDLGGEGDDIGSAAAARGGRRGYKG